MQGYDIYFKNNKNGKLAVIRYVFVFPIPILNSIYARFDESRVAIC
jgi:hypothetical protein